MQGSTYYNPTDISPSQLFYPLSFMLPGSLVVSSHHIFRLPTSRFALSLLLLLIMTAHVALAQDAEGDEGEAEQDTIEVAEPWELEMEGSLSASQVAYRDWAEGGVNSLTLTLGTEGEASRLTPNWSQRYRSRLRFGVIQQDTLEIRKEEDRIRLESSLRYRGGSLFRYMDPTFTGSVRTQFTAGLNYDEDPFDDDGDRELPIKVSDFMSPGNFRQSLGLTVEYRDWFEQRVAFAGQENVVVIPRLRPLYGLRPDQMVRFQGGMESVTEIDHEVADNIRIRSNLNVFSAFDDFLDPDVIWESVLGMRVNEWLSVDLEVTAIYEPDVSPDLQLKEVLSLGVSVVFI